MLHLSQQWTYVNLPVHLFTNLSHEGLVVGLTFLHLASGKLPVLAAVLLIATCALHAEQATPVIGHYSCHHTNMALGVHGRLLIVLLQTP